MSHIIHSSFGRGMLDDDDENEEGISSLWIWNSGCKQDVLREASDDEMEWESMRSIQVDKDDDSEEEATAITSSVTDHHSEISDTEHEEETERMLEPSNHEEDEEDYVIHLSQQDFDDDDLSHEDLKETGSNQKRPRRLSAQFGTFTPDDKSVDTANHTLDSHSVGTLSYDDDIVATFDDKVMAEEVSNAVSAALARAYDRFDESKQKRKFARRLSADLASACGDTSLPGMISCSGRISATNSTCSLESDYESQSEDEDFEEEEEDVQEKEEILIVEDDFCEEYMIELVSEGSGNTLGNEEVTVASNYSGSLISSTYDSCSLRTDDDDQDDDGSMFSLELRQPLNNTVSGLSVFTDIFENAANTDASSPHKDDPQGLELTVTMHSSVSNLSSGGISRQFSETRSNKGNEHPLARTKRKSRARKSLTIWCAAPDCWKKVVPKPRMSHQNRRPSAPATPFTSSLSAVHENENAPKQQSLHQSMSTLQLQESQHSFITMDTVPSEWSKVKANKSDSMITTTEPSKSNSDDAPKPASSKQLTSPPKPTKKRKQSRKSTSHQKQKEGTSHKKQDKKQQPLNRRDLLAKTKTKKKKRASKKPSPAPADHDQGQAATPSSSKKSLLAEQKLQEHGLVTPSRKKKKSAKYVPLVDDDEDDTTATLTACSRRSSDPCVAGTPSSTKAMRRVSSPDLVHNTISTPARQKNLQCMEKLNSSFGVMGIEMSPGKLTGNKKKVSLQERRAQMAAKREKLRESFRNAMSTNNSPAQ